MFATQTLQLLDVFVAFEDDLSGAHSGMLVGYGKRVYCLCGALTLQHFVVSA